MKVILLLKFNKNSWSKVVMKAIFWKLKQMYIEYSTNLLIQQWRSRGDLIKNKFLKTHRITCNSDYFYILC